MKTFFFLFLEITLFEPEKPVQFYCKTLFFGDHLILDEKTDSNKLEID